MEEETVYTNNVPNLELIMRDPKFIDLAIKVMEMEPDIDEEYLVPFDENEEDENGNPIVATRKGDYGKMISYVPVKYIRERCDKAFNRKWSFFIIAERKEDSPFDKWSKKDEDYVEGDNYLRCIGMMIVPGLGIKMEYGVKKVFGASEATDWKACKTDAFKKCCEAFGIYLDYSNEEYDEEDNIPADNKKGDKKSKGKKSNNLDDLEYTDEDYQDALEAEINFGKHDGETLAEIMEDDLSYIEWLSTEARDEDIKFFAQVLLKHNEEQENERRSRKKGKGSESVNSKKDSKGKGKNKNKNSDDEYDDEIETLRKACQEELDNYERVQRKSMISSVSVSNKYPRGKTKLSELTLKELQELAEILEIE